MIIATAVANKASYLFTSSKESKKFNRFANHLKHDIQIESVESLSILKA